MPRPELYSKNEDVYSSMGIVLLHHSDSGNRSFRKMPRDRHLQGFFRFFHRETNGRIRELFRFPFLMPSCTHHDRIARYQKLLFHLFLQPSDRLPLHSTSTLSIYFLDDEYFELVKWRRIYRVTILPLQNPLRLVYFPENQTRDIKK